MSSFDLVNAPDSVPFSCFCGTSGQPPFIRTTIARPGGGVYFICGTCARRIMVEYRVVARIDFDALQQQLATANERLAELDAVNDRAALLQAELTGKEAELDLLRAEMSPTITALAQAQRDIEDLTNGLMPDSWLAQARDAIAARAVAESEARDATEQPPKKRATVRRAA